MSTTSPTVAQPSNGAHLAELLVDALRLIRTLRAEYRASAELLQLKLAMLRERDAELDRLRECYHRLLDERRSPRLSRSEPRRPAA